MNDGYRKAALKLHAMHPEDQQWMLQQLGEVEKTQIVQLLQELRDLGIERTEDFSEEITADELRSKLLSACEDREAVENAFSAIRSATARDIADVLSGEPDSVVAAILALYPWTWRAEFLSGAGVESRLRLSRILANSTLKPRVACEMILIVAHRLAEVKKQHFDLIPLYIERTALAQKVVMDGSVGPFWKRWKQWLR